MQKKKFVFLCVASMLISVFAGCNKPPTAEELVTNAFANQAEAADMDITMYMEAGAEADGFSMDMTLDMDFNVKSTKDIASVDGKMTIGMLGMEVAQDLKVWTDNVNGVSYTYTEVYENWIKEAIDAESLSSETESTEATVNLEIFENLVLAEIGEEDTEYVVTAVMDFGNAYEMMGMDMEEIAETAGGLNVGDIVMDVTLRFDRETEALTGMTMVAQEASLASLSADGVTFSAISLEAVVKEVPEDFTLEIPASVVENAVSADELSEALEGIF